MTRARISTTGDSSWNIFSQNKKASDSENILQKLGIDDPEPERVVKNPLRLIDIAIDLMVGEDEEE